VSGHRNLLLVLALVQAALGGLAALGQLLFTGGNPVYLPVPVARAVLLVVAALAAGAGRRWGAVVLIVLAGLSVAGWWLSALVGVLPWVDDTVNLVGLLANLALPAATLWLAVSCLRGGPRRAPPGGRPVALPGGSPVARPAPTLALPTEYLR
jgi:hypothetical protein